MICVNFSTEYIFLTATAKTLKIKCLILGKRHDNTESIEQANYCFDQIKQSLAK